MAKVVIVGAGLTGISVAYHLEQKGFTDFKLVEKEDGVGGLCRSVYQDGFTFDYTGHLLHTSDDYFRSLIDKTVGFENLNAINRRSFIYSHNTYTRYPYQVNLCGLPTNVIVDCIKGFVERTPSRKKAASFHDWVLTNFGAGFAKHFFFPYQKKIFAFDVKKLSASWTGRFVPSTSLEQIIEGALHDTHEESIGYNAQFFYPKQDGIIFWIKKLAEHVKSTIHTHHTVTRIDAKQKVVHFADGSSEPYNTLITTMPLDTLLDLLDEPATTSLKRARSKLLCNSVINFNIGVRRPDLSDRHWIYYPEKKYPFYRIGFPHNFADSMAPEGCSSLYGEFSHLNSSPATIKQTLKKAIAATKNVLDIDERDVVTEKVMAIKHAYVIYDAWRDKQLPKLHQRLNEMNIFSVGRYGEWKYSSMQEGVLDGKAIVDRLFIKPAEQALYMPTSHLPYRQPQKG